MNRNEKEEVEHININQNIEDILMNNKSNYVKKEEFSQNILGDQHIEGI